MVAHRLLKGVTEPDISVVFEVIRLVSRIMLETKRM